MTVAHVHASHSGCAATCSSAARSSFGVFTVSQRPVVAVRAEAPLGGELGERRRLVVAALGKPLERLLAEDVDAAADPVRDRGRASLKPVDDVVVAEVDDAERRARPRDGDRRRRAASRGGARAARAKSTSTSSSPFSAKTSPLSRRCARREADPAAAAERLGLLGRDDLGAEPAELALESSPCPAAQRHDHAVDARRREPRRPGRRRAAGPRPRRAPSGARRRRRRGARPCRRRG